MDQPGTRPGVRGRRKAEQALSYLQRAVLAGGEFDHPLTSIALLELGRLAFQRGQYPIGLESSSRRPPMPRSNYPDYGVLEEAFRYGMLTHLLSNRKGLFRPWSRPSNGRR